MRSIIRKKVVLPCLIILFGFLGGTQPGLWLTLKSFTLFGGSAITVDVVEGRLLGPWSLSGVSINTDSMAIRIARLAGDWHLSQLFKADFKVAEITIDGLVLRLKDSPETSQPSSPSRLPPCVLPLGIFIERFVITGLQLQNSQGEGLFTIDKIGGQVEGSGKIFKIHDFSLDTPELGMTMHGYVDMNGNWPVDLLGSWREVNYGFHRLDGTFSVTGPLNSPHVSVGMHQPGNIRVSGAVTNLLGSPEWTATVETQNLDLSTFIKHCPAIKLSSFHGRVNGDTKGYRGIAQAEGTWGTLGNLHLHTTLAADWWGIDFPSLRVAGAKNGAEATGAKISWKNIFDWEGRFHFWNFDPGAFLTVLHGNLNADFTNKGAVRSDLGVDISFDVAHLEGKLREQPIALLGNVFVTENDVRTDGLTVRSGEVEGVAQVEKGIISWVEKLNWHAKVRFDNFDPSALYSEFPGRINGFVAGEGILGNDGPEGYIKVTDLSGKLRGRDLSGNGEIGIAGNSIHTPGLFLRLGETKLQVEGKAGDAFALDFTFSSPDLGAILPDSQGALNFFGKLGGSWISPVVEADVSGRDLRFANTSVARLEGNIAVGLTKNGRLEGLFRTQQFAIADFLLDQGQIAFAGTTRKQQVILNSSSSQRKLQFRVDAALEEEWRGEISDFSLATSVYGTWKQQDKINFFINNDRMHVDSFCLKKGDGGTCVGGEMVFAGDKIWKINGMFWGVSLNDLALPKLSTVPVKGRINGEFVADGNVRRLTAARLDVRLPEVEFLLGSEDEEYNSIQCENTTLAMELADSRLKTSFATKIRNGGQLTLMATTNGVGDFALPFITLPVKGTVDLREFDLAFLSSFTGYGIDPSGRVNSLLSLGGTIGRPELSGQSRIVGGGIALPYQGITLENVAVSVVAAEDGANVLVQATSGAGEIGADGHIRYGVEGIEGSLKVKGKDFLLVNLPEYTFRVTPDIQFDFSGDRGALKGKIDVPSGLLTPEEMSNSIQTSQDVILVSGRQETKKNRLPVALDLDVQLGDEVFVDGYGVTGKLEGRLLVKTTPDQLLTGKGELDLKNGVFAIYGRTLDIERGRLLFTGGPIDNPGLDVRAQKKFSDEEARGKGYTVGLDISGLVQNLHYDLISDPYMDDTEILSQMIVGHSLAFSTKEEGSLLEQAAKTLGLQGGANLFQGIGDILQLDDMHLEGSSKKENVSLVVGKRLTDKLYIGYDMNMFSQLGQFRVRYDLDHGFAVETKSSSQATGADLLYSFEK